MNQDRIARRGSGRWVGVVVAIALVGLLGALRCSGPSRGAGAPDPVGRSDPPVGAATAGRTADAERGADRKVVDATGAGPASASRALALRGWVVDAAGAGIAGAEVVAATRSADGFAFLDRAEALPVVEVGRCRTGPDGGFAFPVDSAERSRRLAVSAAGHAPQQRTGCRASEPVTFQMTAGARARFVVERSGGDRMAAVRIVGRRRALGHEGGIAIELFSALTDADGVLEPEPFAAGAVEVDVIPPRGSRPRGFALEFADGEFVEHRVVIVPGDAVRGLVIDAVTGAAIPDAVVGEGWRAERAVRSGRDGRFEFLHFSREQQDLGVRADGYGSAQLRVRVDGVLVSDEVTIRLTPGLRVVGRVLDAEGEPVAGAYVAVAGCEFGDRESPGVVEWRATRSGTDGRFELADVTRAAPLTMVIRRPGFGTVVRDLPDAAGAHLDVGDLRSEAGAVLRGRVVSELGEPLPGLRVELGGHDAGRFVLRAAPNEDYRAVDGYVASRTALTDNGGRYAFDDVAVGDYAVTTGLPNQHGVGARQALRVDRAQCFDVGDLVVFVGSAIEGRVRVDDGGALPTCYVSIDPTDGAMTPANTEVARDGRFRVTGLQRGLYDLTFYPYPSEADRAAGRVFRSCVVPGVVAGGPPVVVVLGR